MEYKFICGRHQYKEKELYVLECCQLKKDNEYLLYYSESSFVIVSGNSSLQDHQEASEVFNFDSFKDTKIENNPIIDLILQHNLIPDKFDAIINQNDHQFEKLAHSLSRKIAEWFFKIYKQSNFNSHYFERPEFLTSKEGHLAVQIASTITLSTTMNYLDYQKENREICKIKPDGTIYFVTSEMQFLIRFFEDQKPYLPNITKKSQTDVEKLQREIKLVYDSLLKDIQSKYSAWISK
ncbi:7512_t:CDS:2 [Scutellospora calospora]|uniref:7512_t:CDS:1 n=1 Tax=Scutellospora calospora TaxID=85575 RepID=A0ACA9KY86_9GLOM|nr:7512_t:CDS:2 [Scutellospora calospora]